jgi:D-beta-D-heptose 7-phosphate kinase/D-beta-D-heptose 1-phosphate adenosyltransferase
MNKLITIVENFQKAKIAVFGDVMLDQFTYGTVDRVSPEAPVPVIDIAYADHRLGGCGNVANNLSSFKAETYVFGICGKDSQSEILSGLLKEKKIHDMVLRDATRPTTTKHRIIAHKQQIARIDNESRNPITSLQEKEIIKLAGNIIKDVDAVILSDYAKGFLVGSLCESLISLAKKANKPVIVDPKAEFSKYKGASTITPNFEEFKRFGKLETDKNPVTMSSHAKKVMELNNIENILVTLGENGMTLFQKSGYAHVKALRNGYDVIDITGAGDTSIAVYALALSCGASHIDAMRLANFAAGVVVTKFGTATCAIDELKGILKNMDSAEEVALC